MLRINTLPLLADRAPDEAAQSMGINPVDSAGYQRINGIPVPPYFTHKRYTLGQLSTHKRYTQQAAKLGTASDSGRFLYLFLPVFIKEPICSIASLWKTAKAPYHIGPGFSASYMHSRKVKTNRRHQAAREAIQ